MIHENHHRKKSPADPSKSYGILGLGKSGLSAAEFLMERGCTVTLSDDDPSVFEKRAIELLLERGALRDSGHMANEIDVLIVSPGIPPTHPAVLSASGSCTIMSEIELGYHHCRSRIFSVTGSDGKSTTCALLAHVLLHAGYDVALAGNIGTPFTSVVERLDSRSIAVVEISSYQLELTESFSSDAAAILNLAPDHLARHGSMEAYAQTKAKIFHLQHSSGWQVINGDQEELDDLLPPAAKHCIKFSLEKPQEYGTWLQNGVLLQRYPGSDPVLIMSTAELRIIGRHNIANALAVMAMTLPLEIDPSNLAAGLASFGGLPHRMERLGTSRGIRFINDSKATNIHAAASGLECLPGPLVVLIGGKDKGLSFVELLPILRNRTRMVIAFGESGPRIREEIGNEVKTLIADDMEEAFKRANAVAQTGDIVILSPACSSFDQYSSFEERGDHFRSLVTSLPGFSQA